MEKNSIEGLNIVENKHRVFWIDALRAFAVFCIVWGHALRNATVIYPWLYCFHVPLCIVTSGIVFHHNEISFWKFIKNKFLSLMVPYFCFAFISIILYAILGNIMEQSIEGEYNISLFESIKGMLYANSGTGLMRWNMPLWYLPMLFVLLLFGWFLYRDSQKAVFDWIILGGSILFAIISYTFAKIDNLPFGLETAIFMFPFFACGRLLIRYDGRYREIPFYIRLVIGILFITIGTLMSKNVGQVSYNSDNYGAMGYPYFLMMSFLFCLGFYSIIGCLKKRIVWLEYMGMNTIGIMVMHKFPILFFIGVFPLTRKLTSHYPLAVSIAVTILTIALCLLASTIICRVCPFILGKKRKEKQ